TGTSPSPSRSASRSSANARRPRTSHASKRRRPMAEVATLATSTTRPKRRYTHIRPGLLAQIYRLKGRGLTHAEIANRLRIAECSVSRALRKPLSPTQFSDMSRRCGLNKVDKPAARERVKDILMEGLVEFVHPLLNLLDDTLANDTRGLV